MSEDPIHRAARWQAFYHEEGGLGDCIRDIRRAYFERYCDAKTDEERKALSIVDKGLAQVDAYFVNIINGGKVQQAAQDHADKIARLSEARRRFL